MQTPPRQPTLPIHKPDICWSQLKDSQSFTTIPTKKSNTISPNDDHYDTPSSKSFLRIACISDTHGKHWSIPIPKCDILIHGGDFTQSGETKHIQSLSDYFSSLKEQGIVKKDIICIAGNHDMTLHADFYQHPNNWKRFHPRNGPLDCNAAKQALQNCIYLEDEMYDLNIDDEKNDGNESCNVKFYGSPWSPTFHHWAFNAERDTIHEKWDMIPTNKEIDVLITHGPPLGRNDYCRSNNRAGCLDLLRAVQNDIQPRVHIFGHIHEDSGVSSDGQTLFINASSVDIGYQPDQPCIVFDLPHDKTQPAVIVEPSTHADGEGVAAWLKKRQSKIHRRKEDELLIFDEIIACFENIKPLVIGQQLLDSANGHDLEYVLQSSLDDPKYSMKIKALGQIILEFRADCYDCY